MSTPKKDNLADNFAFQLEANAKDSLRHGIEHFLDGQYASNLKQAILLVFHSVELFLKARLAKEHKTLIFEKPETGDSKDAFTVGLNIAIARLKVANITVESDAVDAFKHLQRVRNRLEHHEYSGSLEETTNLIGRTLKALEGFLNTHLEMGWDSFLENETVVKVEELVLSYDEHLRKARERADSVADHGCDNKTPCDCIVVCPACGEKTVPCPDGTSEDSRKTRCYFCDEPFFINYCDQCGERELSDVRWDDDPESYPNLCESCEDHHRSQ